MKNLTTDYLISPLSPVDELSLINDKGRYTPQQSVVGFIENSLHTLLSPILTDCSGLLTTAVSTFPPPNTSSILKFCNNQDCPLNAKKTRNLNRFVRLMQWKMDKSLFAKEDHFIVRSEDGKIDEVKKNR